MHNGVNSLNGIQHGVNPGKFSGLVYFLSPTKSPSWCRARLGKIQCNQLKVLAKTIISTCSHSKRKTKNNDGENENNFQLKPSVSNKAIVYH